MGRTILLLANDSDLLVTRALVLIAGGYQTLQALTVADGLVLLKEKQPDIVLLGHGYSAVERARVLAATRRLPSPPRVMSLGEGIVHPPQLLRACRECLESRSTPTPLAVAGHGPGIALLA